MNKGQSCLLVALTLFLFFGLTTAEAQQRFTVPSSARGLQNAKQAAQIRLLETWAGLLKSAITVTEAGNIGIGINETHPDRKLSVVGGIDARSNNSPSVVYIFHSGPNANESLSWLELWGTNPTRQGEAVLSGVDVVLRSGGLDSQERVRITPSGNVGIGTGAPSQKLHVIGNGLFTGSLTANAFYQQSDVNLKQNITLITNPLALLHDIEGKRFFWKAGNRPAYGLIAQDVEQVMPEAVRTDESGIKSVDYSQMIAPLIEAVKQLENRVRTLEAAQDRRICDDDGYHEKNGVMYTRGSQ